MRCVMAIVLLDLRSVPAYAQQPTCKLQSIEKKLTGQALSNFMEKCGDDAQKTCEQMASARRLEEPGRTLFISSCIKGFVG
jgi:hypothetical protein